MRESKTNERVTCGKKETFHLSDVGSNSVGREKMREREKERKEKREE